MDKFLDETKTKKKKTKKLKKTIFLNSSLFLVEKSARFHQGFLACFLLEEFSEKTKKKKKMAVKQDHEATVKFFEENGYAVVPSFASHEECDGMMERMAELVQDWYQSAVEKEKKELESGEKGGAPHIFSTGEKSQLSHQAKDKYFLESANRIHFFLESTALSPDSTCPLSLKPGISPLESLNKVFSLSLFSSLLLL